MMIFTDASVLFSFERAFLSIASGFVPWKLDSEMNENVAAAAFGLPGPVANKRET